MRLRDRFHINRPLEELEVALVRASIANAKLVSHREEAVLRTALSLARLYKVRHDGHDVGVGAFLEAYRLEVERRLKPVLLPRSGKVERSLLMPHLQELEVRSKHTLEALVHRFQERLPREAIERELRHKALVLVLGGGGGTAYTYLGVLQLLDEQGLHPKLMVGTSMGAVISLFRSRMARFDRDEVANIVRNLSWGKLFRAVSTHNIYGVPAALRLFLRSGIGRWFGVTHQGSEAVRLDQLPIKTIIAVSGIRVGKLPHPLAFYETLTESSPRWLMHPLVLPRWVAALGEFATHPELMVKVHLGADEETSQFDALDAAGFSSALPGVIHYDVLRDDARMHGLLRSLMERRRVIRLVDGGLVDNLPAKAAWRAVHKGLLGTRNAFILALNGFAPKWRQPSWLVLQQLAELNVSKNRPWAHLVHDFRKTLGPTVIVPSMRELFETMERGREELQPELAFIRRMLEPLPPL